VRRRGFVQGGHFPDKTEGGSSSDTDIHTLGAKTFGFFEIYGESASKRRGGGR